VTVGHIKKTLNEFKELDAIIESRYAKYIKKGILIKQPFPKLEEYNFNSIPSIANFKN